MDAEFALNTDWGRRELRDGKSFFGADAEKVYLTFHLEVRNKGRHSYLT